MTDCVYAELGAAYNQAIAQRDVTVAASTAAISKALESAQARIRELEAELEKSVNNARGLWIDAEQQAQRVRELEAERDAYKALADQRQQAQFVAENDAAMVRALWKADVAERDALRDWLIRALPEDADGECRACEGKGCKHCDARERP